MSLTILSPGLHSLPVDLGRPRSRALGVPLGGAADRFSFQIGNLLLGNRPDAVAIELTLAGPTLRAEADTVAVILGAPFEARVNGTAISPNTTFRLRSGDVLTCGGTPTGCRAYLCVAGGFDRPEVLGSRSGLEPLKAGEVLECERSERRVGIGVEVDWLGERGASAPCFKSQQGADAPCSPRIVELRVLPGPQAEWFTDHRYFEQYYTVNPASNRMGVRLLGEPLARRPGELVSEPVAPGAVQVTNDGQPVVLGVDGQTIGGYPKVTHVIRADLDLLGRLRPGDQVRFALVTTEEAEKAAAERTRSLRRWALRFSVAGITSCEST